MDTIWPFISIVLVIPYMVVISYGCDDVNNFACSRLLAAKPDMCNDTCFASACKRTCGMCPLKCYSCTDIDSAERCNTTIECPGTDYQCITGVSFTNDFRQVYKLGCAPVSVCSHYGKRSVSKRADASCCSSDLCNHNRPTKRSTDIADFRKDSSRETSPSVCDDTDELACTILYTANPHVCADDCFADRICPRLCGRCSECYICDHVNEAERCNQTRVCDKGEVCFTVETLDFKLQHGYRMGCLHHKICDSLETQAGSIFGRRSANLELSLTGGCCHGDLCNHHKLVPISTATSTTTKAPCRDMDPRCNDFSFVAPICLDKSRARLCPHVCGLC